MTALFTPRQGETPRFSPEQIPVPARPTFTELALAVSRAPDPRERDAAWQQLQPAVRAIASRVASRFPSPIRQDLPDEVLFHVWKKLAKGRFDPRTCSTADALFFAWCRVVVRRYALDAVDDERTTIKGGADDKAALVDDGSGRAVLFASPPKPAEGLELIDEQKRLFGRIRQALDVLAEEWAPAGRVNYYAVLLANLRQAVARRLLDGGLADGDGVHFDGPWPCDRVSRTVAVWLPWHVDELRLRYKRGMPELQALWPLLAAAMDAPPHDTSGNAAVGALVAEAGPDTARLVSADVWAHWVMRAKKNARHLLGEAVWDELFALWMPDRELVPSPSRPAGDGFAKSMRFTR